MDTFKHRTFIVSLLGLLLLAGAANAARDPTDPFHDWKSENELGEFSYDDSQDKAWQENAVELRKLPADDDLLAVQVDSLPDSLQVHLAASSLTYTPADRVLRYWVVITSPAGAYNASFEGMRCDVGEYRIYAYGNPRRTPQVQPAAKAKWQPVGEIRSGSYRPEMMRTLLCNESRRPRQVAEILATLRGHAPYRNPSADNTDF